MEDRKWKAGYYGKEILIWCNGKSPVVRVVSINRRNLAVTSEPAK